MKIVILLLLVLCGQGYILASDGEIQMRQFTIKSGHMYGCNTVNIGFYKPDLYKLSINSKVFWEVKLPGYLYVYKNSKKKAIFVPKNTAFPAAWFIFHNDYHMIFPDFCADASGRLRFWNYKIKLNKFIDLKKNNQRLLNEKYILTAIFSNSRISPIRFLDSKAFGASRLRKLLFNKKKKINVQKDIIWYDFVTTNNKLLIISRITSKNMQRDFSIEGNSFDWSLNSIKSKKTNDNIKVPEDFIPIRAMNISKEFKILTDVEKQKWQNEDTPVFYIWGKSKKDNSPQLAMFYLNIKSKKYIIKIVKTNQIPKTILYNNDSKYIMLLYKQYFTEDKNFKAGMLDITNYLESKKLLRNYSNPIIERKVIDIKNKKKLQKLGNERDVPHKFIYTKQLIYSGVCPLKIKIFKLK